MNSYVIYICGGRNFKSAGPGRKIYSVIDCWRRLGIDVEHVCGGEFAGSPLVNQTVASQSHSGYHQKWYRKAKLAAPLVRSVSEYRDIVNDRHIEVKVRELVSARKPAVIWERSSLLHFAGLRVAKEIGVPYVLEWKDNMIKYKFSLYHRRAVGLERRKNSESDYIVVESNKIKEDLTAKSISAEKILVAHNAVNPKEFCPDSEARQEYRCKLGIKEDQVLIGYAGGYSWYHDMIRLVLAAEILRKQEQSSIKILMVGTGKQYDETRVLAKEKNLLDTVIMMKPKVPKEEVPMVLSSLDVAVLPGCTDLICPIKVQEYMAMELPAVVPDYPCNHEVITDGQNGILFKPRDEHALAKKLDILINSKQTRQNIGAAAREEVVARFTWEKTWGMALQTILSDAKFESRPHSYLK